MALTQKKDREEKVGKLVLSPVAASTQLFGGALVMHNVAGFLANATALAGASFAGVCYEDCDNSNGLAGDKSVRAEKFGSFLMDGTGFSQADVGSEVYASDNDTVSTTQGANELAVGKIQEFVSATQVRVAIDGYAI